jgi:hypothetical protein
VPPACQADCELGYRPAPGHPSCRRPRPLQECLLLERAIIAGCSPEALHRLLLGVTASGVNVLPWLQLMGTGRAAIRDAELGGPLLLLFLIICLLNMLGGWDPLCSHMLGARERCHILGLVCRHLWLATYC